MISQIEFVLIHFVQLEAYIYCTDDWNVHTDAMRQLRRKRTCKYCRCFVVIDRAGCRGECSYLSQHWIQRC